MKIISTKQFLIEAFLVMPATTKWERPRPINGEQLKIKFTWFAKILIDMKAAMEAGAHTQWFYNRNKKNQLFMTLDEMRKEANEPKGCMHFAMKAVREGMKEFKATGSVAAIPNFVYFIN